MNHNYHNHQTKKSLGQNFIRDESLLDRLAELSGVTADECVFEVGAGLGGLTVALAKRAQHVLAIEIDRDLEPALTELSLIHNNISILICDAVKADWSALLHDHLPEGVPVRFVSNLPYYITTLLLMRAFQFAPPFAGVACMVQTEVAVKLTAAPGTPEYGPLAIWAQAVTVPRVGLEVPRVAFDPPPSVDSSFVMCAPRERPTVATEDYARFARVVDAAFAMRRKTLRNNFRAAFSMTADQADQWLTRAGIDPGARAETIAPEEFAAILSCR